MICGMMYLGRVAPGAVGLQSFRPVEVSDNSPDRQAWAWESRSINTEHLPPFPCTFLVSLHR